MNIQKGFFRLTLILSILIAIVASFSHKWIFKKTCEYLPYSWKDRQIDGALIEAIRHARESSLPMSEVREYRLKEKTYFFSDRLMNHILFWWRELSLSAFVGFASPWFLYLFIRWVVIAFIIGGFKGKRNS